MAIIIGFWFLFFWDVIINPLKWCNGENVATFFPINRLSGECWRKGKLPHDPYYHTNLIKEGVIHGLFYPPNVLVAYIGSYFSRSVHFRLFVYNHLLHSLWGAIGMYLLTGNVICGLLWGFGGHIMHPEPPWLQTLSWFPWVLMFPLMIGFMILAGFVPAIIILMPLICVKTGQGWVFLLLGVIIGLPALVPLILNLKRNNRLKLPIIGKVPFWHIPTLFFPILPKMCINGVGYYEMNYYLTPLIVMAFVSHNLFLWGLLMLTWVGMVNGCKLWGDRVASRISLCMNATLILMLSEVIKPNILLTLLTMLFLFPNRKTLPVEIYDKSSYDVDDLPNLIGDEEHRTNNLPKPWFQGQLHKIRSVGYVGSSADRRFVFLRGGAGGSHNLFDNMEDGGLIDFMGVRWSYGKRPSKRWVRKGMQLWENTKAFPRRFICSNFVVADSPASVLDRIREVDLSKTVVLEEIPRHKKFLVTNDVYDNHPYRVNYCFGAYGLE